MEMNIIKIQRFYRIFKVNENIKIFNKYDLKCPTKKTFNEYTKIMRNKNVINSVNFILNRLNNLFEKKINIKPQYILTAFLIKNFNEDILGPINNRHPSDVYIYQWSVKLVQIFTKENNTLNECKLLHIYLNNYNSVFENWKEVDKSRTIQNIIVSYYHRQEHLNYIKNEEMNNEQKSNIINELEQESYNLLISIKQIDKEFDIENLKHNYKEIYEKIQTSMNKIYGSISREFKKAYLEILIDEFKNDNNSIIYKLIIETNNRILTLSPKKYKSSIMDKLNSYNYTDILLNKSIVIKEYFEFIIDTLIVLSAPKDDINNTQWKLELNYIIGQIEKNYTKIIPTLLIEINNKIDYIFNQINNLL